MSWFRNLSACKSLPETFADKRAHCGRSADAGGAGRGETTIHIGFPCAKPRVPEAETVHETGSARRRLADHAFGLSHAGYAWGRLDRQIASYRVHSIPQPEKRGAAKAAGATGWLVKPVDATALLQIVTQLSPGK
jgi:hypothetical protein